MALLTAAANVNASIITTEGLLATLFTALDRTTVADKLYLQFPNKQPGVAAASLLFTGPKYEIRNLYAHGVESASNIRWFIPGIDIGGIPLTFRISNSAGDIA